ncbi:TRAP transporter solute receptor, TAXI family [Desulfotomaculum nigrificans CO-1-SRB]|uniref:TRAP transporter solute receptor, TAXI family n=1 Tax=Desulfotomaculum nigrificans (strain DSM 14880 / VKM B-2319 / CO-1-SRB) TaxID=868595 RepID=F6B679_DESCC|nr:TAXI family TRAP transporter solute-binding subunit [Desulfotomaculum nigrificans]AEF95502.1 TRAP transporter solute receptor, TAXI family [Desulfotomaculum nigrificans CO-1-SRB]
MLKLTKRGLALLVALAMLALIAGCGSSTGEQKADQKAAGKKFINIATGGTAGVYYPLGGAIAEILNKNIPGANATAQSTGASVANINMLTNGSVQLAFVQNDIAYYAANGTEMFKDKKVNGLKALATIYPETVQIVTLEKNGIKSIADLKGKKVAVGAAGSSVTANARQVLEAYGITFNDITPQYLSFAEAANGLKDGNIDAAFVTAGFPTAAIQDIAAQHKVVLLSIDNDKAEQLVKKYPYYTKITIPAKTYPNQEQDVIALGTKAMLVVTDKMDEQTAYDITKAIFTNLEQLKAAHSVGKFISKESAKDGLSIPMHPGAEKYFNEK